MANENRHKTILITGGSGLIGRRLSKMLLRRGHRVLWYTRNTNKNIGVVDGVYYYDIDDYTIDTTPLLSADVIIHLAGANISSRRWTRDYKKEIIRSRVISLQLIYRELQKLIDSGESVPLKHIITASAIGYYGSFTSREFLSEEDEAGEDFLAKCSQLIEDRTKIIGDNLNVETSIVRTGVALTMRGGALPKMYKPIRLGLNTIMGSGNQFINWIHLEDLCRIYIKLVEGDIPVDTYNAVAPSPVTNEQFMYALSFLKGRWLPKVHIPEDLIRFIFGDVSSVMLEGSPVSCQHLLKEGFTFRYPTLGRALRKSILKQEFPNVR